VKHPAETKLALYAGGDLGWWARLGIARHVERCGPCRRQVEAFRGMCEMLHGERHELPPGLEWSEAAAAMRANIRLGIAAGECVAEPPEPRRSPWRPALALPILLLIVAGVILESLPQATNRAPAPERSGSALVLDASPAGIGVERDGHGFQLLRPAAAESVEVLVRGDSVRSRYVDGETGQVTISHVYAE
jgi:hypothetical protein